MEKSKLHVSTIEHSKYPVLNNNVNHIHKIPNRSLIFACRADQTKIDSFLENDLYEVSLFYEKVLSDCNGKFTIKQIINRYEKNGISEYDIISIIENAIFRGWVSLCDESLYNDSLKNCHMGLSGDMEHFYPRHLMIELTDICNLKCKHCYRNASAKGRYISKKDFFNTIDIFVSKGLDAIELTGGEPLLHPDFSEIVCYAASRLDIVAVLTNGTHINEAIIEKLKPYKDKILFSVSIDSSTSEFHDDFRGSEGSWAKANKAVSLLAHNGFLTRVAMSIAPGNMEDIENVLLLSKNLGAKSFSYSMIMPFGRGSEITWNGVTKDEFLRYITLERKVKKRYREMIPTVSERSMKCFYSGESNCGGGWRSAVISPSGDLRPCVNVAEGFLNIGNIFEEGTEVFKKPVLTALSEMNVPRSETCANCSLAQFCNSCWYRGLVGSTQVPDCKWDCEKIKSYLALDSMKKIQDTCITNKMTLLG